MKIKRRDGVGGTPRRVAWTFEKGIKKAMTFAGNRSKSSIGISSFKVKRLFSG